MVDALPKKTDSFQQILDALVDENQVFPAVYLHRFSDPSPEDLKALQAVWEKVPEQRRAALVEDLEELYDSDTLTSFEGIARIAITDSHAPVRAGALRLLWDYQGRDLIPVYQFLLEKDPDEIVRAQAASLLGQFVYLGELEEISSELHHAIEDALLQVVESSETKLVRRRALESLGYSSRDEISHHLQTAFESGDFQWMASALFAMGRSTDEIWGSHVLKMIDHPERDVQLEAIRAAGMLELEDARVPLLRMAKSGIDDSDMRGAISWSLSQIGGDQVGVILNKLLARAEDDEEAEFIQSAIDNLEFKQGEGDFDLFDASPARPSTFHIVRPSPDGDEEVVVEDEALEGDGIPEGDEALEGDEISEGDEALDEDEDFEWNRIQDEGEAAVGEEEDELEDGEDFDRGAGDEEED
ncbi:protein containg HEAT repeats [Longilinea arvoryzae]|uniref:Protein containg HEAT repeats n=1 Tax=Longilinea arvoryzae TaxID=360412 RepID=A0A0S7BLL1_9CHLR|nr:HEAT repeat domain-containing protein [Longilinea arvoryzae]GAP15074.1 protein containg HEAT repeats [Longilinea arvoryzae]